MTTYDEQEGTMGSTISDAAERVRAAVAGIYAQRAIGEANRARIAAERAAAEARRGSAAAKAREAVKAREEAVREAFAATDDAVRRAERAAAIANQDVKDFRRDHVLRRDVTLARLERDLALVPGDLDASVARAVAGMNGPLERAGTETLALIVGLDHLARPEAAARLRQLVAAATFSPLSSDEVAARLVQAREHRRVIDEAVRDTHDAARRVGAALKALSEGGPSPDPTAAAADALAANDAAQAALRDLRAALNPEQEDQ